jgi:hypothetical protein
MDDGKSDSLSVTAGAVLITEGGWAWCEGSITALAGLHGGAQLAAADAASFTTADWRNLAPLSHACHAHQ